MNNSLQDLIRNESERFENKSAQNLVDSICKDYPNPESIHAIILYGSGLWQSDEETSADKVWDLYVLIDDFKSSDASAFLRVAGHLMPPNVYYIDEPARCKYALIRLDQFERACAGKTLIPQIWARFSQPCRVVYSRNEESLKRVNDALSEAVITFHRKNFSALQTESGQEPSAKAIWLEGLKKTYASELRSEDPARPETIFTASQESFEERTKHALPLAQSRGALGSAPRILVKILYFIQIMKATFTFKGGVDYALWKIERHSGVRVEATDFQRRYPLIGAWPLLWKIYKKGGLR